MDTHQTGPGKGGFFSLFAGLAAGDFKTDVMQRLVQAMDSPAIVGSSSCDSGYVYLGQFIAHDITKRGSLRAGEFVPASELVQLRTPALDLDNVYGDGFDDPKIAVDKHTGKMRLGRVVNSKNEPGSYNDLPRKGLKALIGDERDDENLLVAQLHVQFLKLHNLFVERIGEKMQALQPYELFEKARRKLISCYHDVVLYDFLPAVLDPKIWDRVILNKQATLWKPAPGETARMPIEFAAAAFRFGHAMVRPSYQINNRKQLGADELSLMTGANPSGAEPFGGRGGLPDSHVVDWRLFFTGLCSPEELAFAVNAGLPIDPTMGVRVGVPQHPGSMGPGQDKVLFAALDLPIGNSCMLPDAQAIVGQLLATDSGVPGLVELTVKELNPEGLLRGDDLHGLTEKSPLFYYILCEAHLRQGGDRLGPLGSLIVAETLLTLIDLSPPSAMHEGDEVLGDLGVKATGEKIGGRPRFKMIDLLRAIDPQGGTGLGVASNGQPPLRDVA